MFSIKMTHPFPASRLGKPCYLGFLMDGNRFKEIRFEGTRPAYAPIAAIMDSVVFNTEMILFPEVRYDEGTEGIRRATHVGFYTSPSGGDAFLAIPLDTPVDIPDGSVPIFEPGLLKLPIARGM